MAKSLPIFLIIITICFFSFSDKSKGRKAVFQQIAQNVDDYGQSYENLKFVTESIGHRLTGSENGQKAEQYAFEAFEKYTYKNVEYLPFQVKSWTRNKVSLAIVPGNSDNFRDVDAVSLAFTPIAANEIERIIDCGDGLEEDFDIVGGLLKGKIALFNINVQLKKNEGLKNLHRSEKTALAIKYGAAGVIIANSVEGEVLLTGTASATGKLIPIPAVCVSLESGQAIRRWIRDEKNILAEIEMLNYYSSVQARNISALHRGQQKFSDEKIVIAGHLDSWELATGAVDNGLGSFSVMDIARVFKDLKLKTKRPIEFILFMGEEQGMLGSTQYLKESKQNGSIKDIALMINLDMINNTHGFNAMGNEELKDFIQKIGLEIKSIDPSFKNENLNQARLHSDHQPFLMSGIPVCLPVGILPQKARNCYHADCDFIDLIEKDHMSNNVKYTAMMLYALANADKLPQLKSSQETKDYLIAQNLKKELILAEKWLWEE